jgi:hypothetical protein
MRSFQSGNRGSRASECFVVCVAVDVDAFVFFAIYSVIVSSVMVISPLFMFIAA